MRIASHELPEELSILSDSVFPLRSQQIHLTESQNGQVAQIWLVRMNSAGLGAHIFKLKLKTEKWHAKSFIFQSMPSKCNSAEMKPPNDPPLALHTREGK